MAVMDPISDMFTRIRNAINARHDEVSFPFSTLKLAIIKILKEEGFIKFYEIVSTDLKKKVIKIGLKYSGSGKNVITKLETRSRPSHRVYVQKNEIPKVLNGFGTSILSTSKGVLSGRSARLQHVGGELIGIVY